MRHMLDGLMQATNTPNHKQLGILLGLDNATISRIHHGKLKDVRLHTLASIRERSGVPFDTLFAWFALPDGAVLGRIAGFDRSQP